MTTVVRYEAKRLVLGDVRISVNTAAFDSPELFHFLIDASAAQPIRLLRYLLDDDGYLEARQVLLSADGNQAENVRSLVATIMQGECPELGTFLWMMHEYPSELRFDFRRFLSINLDEALETDSPRLLAQYAVAMPAEGSLHRSINPDWRWGIESQLLAGIYDHMSFLRWEAVKIAGGKPGNAPDQLERPGVNPKGGSETIGASEGFESIEDFKAAYAEIRASMKPAPE